MNALRALPVFLSLTLLLCCRGPSPKPLPPPEVQGEVSPERIKRIINERVKSIRSVEVVNHHIEKGTIRGKIQGTPFLQEAEQVEA